MNKKEKNFFSKLVSGKCDDKNLNSGNMIITHWACQRRKLANWKIKDLKQIVGSERMEARNCSELKGL